jgi:hypothetical protein
MQESIVDAIGGPQSSYIGVQKSKIFPNSRNILSVKKYLARILRRPVTGKEILHERPSQAA